MIFRFKHFGIVLFLFLLACKTTSSLSEINWFLGKWQVNESNSFEEWIQIDSLLYRGKGYKIRKNDTLITETIDIVQKGKEIFYIPSVTDQNDGKPVDFQLVSKKAEKVIFENKNHDFPQRIIYTKNGNDQIDARIEGIKQGFFSEIKFTLKRVN
jgi:Domain of unknown function (DUF6265)